MVRNDNIVVIGTNPSGLIAAQVALKRGLSVTILTDYTETDDDVILFNHEQLQAYSRVFECEFSDVHIINYIDEITSHEVKGIFAVSLRDLSSTMLNVLANNGARLLPRKIKSLDVSNNKIITSDDRLILYEHLLANDGFYSCVAKSIVDNVEHMFAKEGYLHRHAYLASFDCLSLNSVKGYDVQEPIPRPIVQHNWCYLLGRAAGFYHPVFGVSASYEMHCASAAIRCIVKGGSYKDEISWMFSDMMFKYRLRKFMSIQIRLLENEV